MRLILILFTLVMLGCDRASTEIVVQQAPKQPRPAMVAQMPPTDPHAGLPDPHAGIRAGDPHAAGAAAGGQPLHWTVPDGWKELPGSSMRYATLVVSENPKVELTVIPLAGDSGGILANINRWEGQLKLKPSAEQDLPKISRKIEVEQHDVFLVDLIGPESENPRQRMLAAMVMHDGRTWYFKMQGSDALVGKQTENFESFIKSIHFHGSGDGHAHAEPGVDVKPQAAAQGQGTVAAAEGMTYTIPAGWAKSPDRPMRIATLTAGNPPAEMIASRFPINSGTVLENFNRWRGQVGMQPVQKQEDQPTRPITVGGADGVYLDLTGPQHRMLVAWVTRGNEWWFFKFTGPGATIEQQQAAFNDMLKSVKFGE